ncbi:phytanoyl-CoA dioxygenase family protein, partial [Streptomyces rochei]|uniref:phytanoyl-CoA dioxygenase family protein n=1 Tax=Streptomyces rochei TaxID=1928 RepID=UPI0022E9C75D
LGPFTAFDPQRMQQARQTILERVLTTPTRHCPFGLRVRHLDSRTVYDLCSSPEILGRMASLYGPDLVLWNSNLFNKPPARPEQLEEYPWHQDHYNWNMEPVLNISAWLAIGPATEENGCVQVIPGSHRQIVPPVTDTNPDLSLRFGGVA